MQRTLFELPKPLEEKLTTVQHEFVEWLKKYHCGKENAVTSKKMSQWGKGVEIRSMVHELRIEGFPICSDNDGYYYASTASDLQATINIMKSRMTEIGNVHNALVHTYRKMEHDEIGT